MSLNKWISRFLVAIILNSCVAFSFNGYVLGMESKKSDQEIVNDLSKKILNFIKSLEDYTLFGEIYWYLMATLANPVDNNQYKLKNFFDLKKLKESISKSSRDDFVNNIFRLIVASIDKHALDDNVKIEYLRQLINDIHTLVNAKWWPINRAYDGLYSHKMSVKMLEKGIKLLQDENPCQLCNKPVKQNGIFGYCPFSHLFVFHRACWKNQSILKCPNCVCYIEIEPCFGCDNP